MEYFCVALYCEKNVAVNSLWMEHLRESSKNNFTTKTLGIISLKWELMRNRKNFWKRTRIEDWRISISIYTIHRVPWLSQCLITMASKKFFLIFILLFLFFFLFFIAIPGGIWKCPGQGSNQSCSCRLTPPPQQRQILNPLIEAEAWTCILTETVSCP